MPSAYALGQPAPADLFVPENLIYDYMIYRLSKIFAISPPDAGRMREYDFLLFTGFENLDNKRREYFLTQSNNSAS